MGSTHPDFPVLNRSAWVMYQHNFVIRFLAGISILNPNQDILRGVQQSSVSRTIPTASEYLFACAHPSLLGRSVSDEKRAGEALRHKSSASAKESSVETPSSNPKCLSFPNARVEDEGQGKWKNVNPLRNH